MSRVSWDGSGMGIGSTVLKGLCVFSVGGGHRWARVGRLIRVQSWRN